ncbi:alpha/beta fold hydrolase [bacterium]|nr:alpha/beta fold hydrolase [bacterium]
MKNLIYFLLAMVLVSCDVDSAMLFGETVKTYEFNNAALPADYAYQVDESKVEVFTLTSDDNGNKAEIYCLYLGDKSKIATDTVILYCHGNGPNLQVFWERLAQLANLGGKNHYGILAYDYRGYGLSQGKSTGMGTMLADVDACLQWLKDKGLTGDRFILHGESLGSIPGTYVAGYSQILSPTKYIFEVPQSTADAIGEDASGLSIPSSFLTDFNFDLYTAMKGFKGSLLWMHGTKDQTAPIENARKVYDVFEGKYKESIIVEGAPHGLREYMGIEPWGEDILNFIRMK